MTDAPEPTHLFGVKAIRRFLRETYGYRISRQALHVRARRAEDPFPMHLDVEQSRPRVIASVRRVRAWCRRHGFEEAESSAPVG